MCAEKRDAAAAGYRPGHRQVDTLINLVESPHVGLEFFVPGMTDTMRINWRAEIPTEPELLTPPANEFRT